MGIENGLDWVKWKKDDLKIAFEKEKNRILNIVKDVLIIDRERTFENTLFPLSMVFDERLENSPIYFLQSISTNKEVRDFSEECANEIVVFLQREVFTAEVYKAIYYFKDKKRQKNLNSGELQVFKKLLKNFEKSGFKDDKDQKNPKVSVLIEKISKLQNAYISNMSAKVPIVKFSKKQLDGVPDSFLSSLKIENNKYVIPVGFGAKNEITKFAINRETRSRVNRLFLNRGGQKNLKILQELIELRASLAKELGYKSRNEMAIKNRLAEKVEVVNDFVNDSLNKLGLIYKQYSQELKKLAKKDGIVSSQFLSSDSPFYARIYREKNLDIDLQIYNKYLPYQETIKKIFDFLGKNFGFTAEKVVLPVWHQTVFWYEVKDSVSNEILGYFAFDLIPRDGKDSHAGSHTTLQLAAEFNNKRRVPVSVIMSNDVVKDDPEALLTFSMIETFFHEMGHGLHTLFSRAKYSILAGTNTDEDFVEVPSMGIEKYSRQISCLKDIFTGKMNNEEELKLKRYLDFKIPEVSVNYIVLAFSEIDLIWHSKNKAPSDLMISMNSVLKKRGLSFDPNAYFASSWIHMALDSYVSGYYGYMYSDSIAADMFARFGKNKKDAILFRKEILEVGSMRPEKESIKAFLGRNSNNKNWLSEMGVGSKK